MPRIRFGISLLAFALLVSRVAVAENTLAEAYFDAGAAALEGNDAAKAAGLFTLSLEESAECESGEIFAKALLGAGEATYKLGQLDTAAKMFRMCIHFQDTVDDSESPVIRVAAMTGLSLVKAQQGEQIAAEAVGAKAVAVLEKADMDDSEQMAFALNNLAMVKSSVKDHAEAEQLALRSLAILDRLAQDSSHPQHFQVIASLAQIYHSAGHHDKAEEHAMKAIKLARQHHGDDTPQAAAAMTTLSKVKHAQGKHVESDEMIRMALGIFSKTTHPDHPDHQTALDHLHNSAQKKGAAVTSSDPAPSDFDDASRTSAAPQ